MRLCVYSIREWLMSIGISDEKTFPLTTAFLRLLVFLPYKL